MEQMKKIKVVWLCHFSNPQIREHLPLNKERTFYNFIRKVLGLSPKDSQLGDIAPWVTHGIEEIKKRKNIELYVISPQTAMKSYTREFFLDGVQYYFFNPNLTLLLMHIIKNNKLWRKLQFSSRIINKFIKNIQPDIINLIGAENPYYSCSVLDNKWNIPIMVSLQTIYTNPNRLRFDSNVGKSKNWFIAELIHKRCVYFGATGKMHHDLLKKENPEAIVFKLSWCSSKFPVVKVLKKKYDFVNFAVQLSYKKGFHDSIQALAIVKKKYPKVMLNLVGSSSLMVKNELQSLIAKLDLEKNIHFTPFFEKQEDLFQHLQFSKFAVLPCKIDSISGTMLQAMNYELPLVVYKTPGTTELNKFKECILISDIGDIESLASNMSLLLDNPSLAIELKKNAKELIKNSPSNAEIIDRLILDYYAIISHYHQNTGISSELIYNFNDK